ncbi:NAD(P)-dependent oxidoreductase [Saccharopolyspora elongata]|uniref:NAD-dependent epimerase/dehydratase family protein n=1 Tax=Saccharopolyspora elongata TaxID=2530387 RepID=A0A4R4YU34_9PSEU|nr:NAD(P)H-binding protein [Saccharopolyspora elongata]TDD48793.1 NAD-dependent epimerase/dehydratase family protein [Saccharopolyspora elongata]
MHIGVIGASGNIGTRVVDEALSRGHVVRAYSRNADGMAEDRPNITWASLDVLDADAIARALPGLDVLISAFQPGNAARDFHDTVRRSIADPAVYANAARALLTALDRHPRTRLIVVGGAGSLETEPGVVPADGNDDVLGEVLAEIGLPREYAAAVRGHRDALNAYRLSNRLWTYFSPAAEIAPGERTGRFRIGGDQLITDADGRSRISFEDAAIALVDEAELPKFVQRRFTIGY